MIVVGDNEGVKRSVVFDKDVEKKIERYRKSISPIPTITEAVNDLIRAAEVVGDAD